MDNQRAHEQQIGTYSDIYTPARRKEKELFSGLRFFPTQLSRILRFGMTRRGDIDRETIATGLPID
jgi:hypothetical protein